MYKKFFKNIILQILMNWTLSYKNTNLYHAVQLFENNIGSGNM